MRHSYSHASMVAEECHRLVSDHQKDPHYYSHCTPLICMEYGRMCSGCT